MAKMAIADQVLQRQDKDGMLRRALERIIQLYTDKSHFVYELLQNAEDAGATKIKFEQYPDRLVVLHDGHPFSMENLQGLCDIGKSDKTDDLNQIGEFGVGFKSVFGICETVRLYSHPSKSDQEKGYHQFAVEIKDFTHPVDIDDQDVALGYTTMFVFPYSVGFTFSGFATIEKLNDVLSKRLQNLGITTLLFMKHLQSIDYKIELPRLRTSGTYLLDKTPINDHCSLVSAMGETGNKKENEEISYLMFSRPVTGIQAGRTIDIAFAVKVEESGEYTFTASKSPYISVYFPTETEKPPRNSHDSNGEYIGKKHSESESGFPDMLRLLSLERALREPCYGAFHEKTKYDKHNIAASKRPRDHEARFRWMTEPKSV